MRPEEARDRLFHQWTDAGHCPRCGRQEPLTVLSLTNKAEPADPPFMVCERCAAEERMDSEREWNSRGYWPAHLVRIEGT